MGMGYDEIGEILKLIDGSSCDEFVLETQDIKLIVRRHANGPAIPLEPARVSSSLPPAPAAAASQSVKPLPASTAHDAMHVVRAPMVGTDRKSVV